MTQRARLVRRTAALVAVAVNLVLLLSFYDRFWWPPDEGNFAHVAERILDGEVLHAEVQDVHAGHINFVNAAAMGLFGRRLVSMRYPLVAVALAQAIVIFALLVERGPWIAAIGSTSGTALGVVQFLNPTPHWYCLFLTVVLVYWLHRFPAGAPWRVEVTGALVATIFLFRQLTGVIVGIAVVTFLLLEASSPRAASECRRPGGWLAPVIVATMAIGLLWYLVRATSPSGWVLFGVGPLALLVYTFVRVRARDRLCLELAGRLLIGLAVAMAPLSLYHLSHGSVGAWFSDAVVAAMTLPRLPFVGSASYLTWEVLAILTALAGDGPAVLSACFWSVAPLLALGLAAVVLTRVVKQESAPRVEALPIVAVFYGLVSVHYAIPIYLFYSMGMSVIGLLWVMSARAGSRWGTAAALGALLLAGTAVIFHAGQPLTRGPRGIIEGRREPVVASTSLPRSGLRVDPQSLELYEAIVQLIDLETRPHEAIATVPSNAEIYFLAARRNPFRFYNTALGVRDAEGVADVLRVLRQSRPSLVLFDPADKYNTPQSGDIMAFVRAHYEARGRLGRFEVYRLPQAGPVPE